MASLGNLIPLGKKNEKPAKNDSLTGGLISIGGGPSKSATKSSGGDDGIDDFDLDDLLSDTPKPQSKKGGDSPKKPKKSKDKKKKKKDKSFDDDSNYDDNFDDYDSPPKKSTLKFMDEDMPKPKSSMKNASLDEEFAKALGFDESEFLSSKLDDSIALSPKEEEEPPKSKEIKPPSIAEPDDPFQGKISASFFSEPESTTTSASDTTFRDFGERPKGRGRRSAAHDVDPFSNDTKTANNDSLGKLDDLWGKKSTSSRDTESKISYPFSSKAETKLDLQFNDNDLANAPREMEKEEGGRIGGRGRRRGQIDQPPAEEAAPSLPWMKQQDKPADTANTEDEPPTFPWMKKKSNAAEDEVKPKAKESPVQEKKDLEDDMPSFPWVKKKNAEKQTKSIDEPKGNDLPAFPWMKKTDNSSADNIAPPPQKEPPKPQTPTPSPPKPPVSPPKPAIVEEPIIPVKVEPPPPTLPSTPQEPKTPESPLRGAVQLQLEVENSTPASPPSVPSRSNSPVKESSPRRPVESPPKSTPIIDTVDVPTQQINEPATPPRSSSEKRAPSPSRPLTFSIEPTSQATSKPSSPKRISPTSRASFLSSETTIVPAFVTHQLEQSQEQVATLTAQLSNAASALAALQAEHDQSKAQLAMVLQENETLQSECKALRSDKSKMQEEMDRNSAEITQFAQRVDNLTREKQAIANDVSALRLQTAELPSLQHLVKELQLENGSLRSQLSSAQSSLSACQRDLVKEQSLHAQSVERFQRMQHEREQEALHQQRWQAEEQRHAEKEALERLLTQVRAAVSGLKVLQENVVGSKNEMEIRAVGDNETRARLLLEMEGSCKALMTRSQEECHRLQALLGAMEGTMRTFRGEHMEEKERLRMEQARLDELALHFQSQTTLLQERTDSNTRVVTQTLSAYIQDIRVAEARLHTRREQLQEEERQLHFARAAFAAQQEEALREQRLAQGKIHMEQKRVEEKLHRIRQETQAFEQLVYNHANEMEELAAMQKHIESEKERLREAAARVEGMAEKVRHASERSTEMENKAKEAMHDAAVLVSQVQEERMRVGKQMNQLEEREKRLHEEVRFMESTRRKRMTEERATRTTIIPTQRPQYQNHKFNLSAPAPITPQPSQWATPRSDSRPLKEWNDPSGLSPSFRHEMEQFWSQSNQVNEDMLRNRFFVSCIGLPKSNAKPTTSVNPSTNFRSTKSGSNGSFKL